MAAPIAPAPITPIIGVSLIAPPLDGRASSVACWEPTSRWDSARTPAVPCFGDEYQRDRSFGARAGVVAAGHRVYRRRYLDRVGDPRLPRAQRCLEESRPGRVHDRQLHLERG